MRNLAQSGAHAEAFLAPLPRTTTDQKMPPISLCELEPPSSKSFCRRHTSLASATAVTLYALDDPVTVQG